MGATMAERGDMGGAAAAMRPGRDRDVYHLRHARSVLVAPQERLGPAVDQEDGAGAERGLGTEKEGDCGRDVFGRSEAAGRRL